MSIDKKGIFVTAQTGTVFFTCPLCHRFRQLHFQGIGDNLLVIHQSGQHQVTISVNYTKLPILWESKKAAVRSTKTSSQINRVNFRHPSRTQTELIGLRQKP